LQSLCGLTAFAVADAVQALWQERLVVRRLTEGCPVYTITAVGRQAIEEHEGGRS
jgi:hypothetical protein